MEAGAQDCLLGELLLERIDAVTGIAKALNEAILGLIGLALSVASVNLG